MKRLRLGFFLVVGLAASCASPPAAAPLTIAAAASLAPVFDQLGPLFHAETGSEVVFSYGATGSLAEQLRNGAPFDAFAAADALHIDELIEEGLLVADTRTLFALGKLVIVTAPGSSLSLDSIDDLADPSIQVVAIANPVIAPYGLAATQALERSGIDPEVQPKLVYGETVQQAGQMVSSGNATAGLISATTALSLDLPGLDVPPSLYDPIQQVAAVHAESPHLELATEFLEFLGSPTARAVFERSGLLAPEG